MIRWPLAFARAVRLVYLLIVQAHVEQRAPHWHPERRRIRWDVERAQARLNATWR